MLIECRSFPGFSLADASRQRGVAQARPSEPWSRAGIAHGRRHCPPALSAYGSILHRAVTTGPEFLPLVRDRGGTQGAVSTRRRIPTHVIAGSQTPILSRSRRRGASLSPLAAPSNAQPLRGASPGTRDDTRECWFASGRVVRHELEGVIGSRRRAPRVSARNSNVAFRGPVAAETKLCDAVFFQRPQCGGRRRAPPQWCVASELDIYSTTVDGKRRAAVRA